MPKLTDIEWKILNKLSNNIYDILYDGLNLSEERADKIAQEVISLIVKRAEQG